MTEAELIAHQKRMLDFTIRRRAQLAAEEVNSNATNQDRSKSTAKHEGNLRRKEGQRGFLRKHEQGQGGR
jgi:hypothetical protein